ncbi:MAG TPA: hypothetical protein VFN17_07455 [Nitrosarchaeum sp.]|jgi:DNA-binding Lrp family transcriptional regulator|nr:hypothetical protein [Nitrosarchaeum sp.]
MEEKKSSKLSEIRATAFDAAAIMRQIGTPGVLESLTNVKETASKVNEIIQGLQTPEMVKNIENFRIISENINDTATKMQNITKELKETGIIEKTTSLVDSAKKKIDSFGNGENGLSGQDIHNVIVSTQEMFASIKDLVNEITETISSSKKSDTVTNVQETIKGASEIYKTVASSI